mmetsp:Transcript_58667/g.137881  ORF Transcript_58667/g.137881 Transcript_58667/m.137881 type:complete len:354 (+) Transcript_58667:224-1285(+)
MPRDGVWTGVLKFNVNAGVVTFERLLEVPGSILNQFAMDEYNGMFRIATTYGRMWGRNADSVSNIFIFGPGGEEKGKVTGLGRGERIMSVRFQGPKAYVVTFKKVDPLFVIDLSNPASPEVLGELKIPGWSDYLHPVNDTHMLGLGMAATEEGFALGVKIALFDASDPTSPKEKYSMELGDRGTNTEATWDHRAFLFHAPTGLVVFPIQLRKISEKQKQDTDQEWLRWVWGDLVLDGAVILYLGHHHFEAAGTVSHLEISPQHDSWFWHSVRKIYRAGYMAGADSQGSGAKQEVLFTYSQREIRVYDLEGLEELSRVNMTQPQCYSPPSESNSEAGSPTPGVLRPAIEPDMVP